MEENKNVENIGNLVISEEVIASIALNAAKDVEGVSGFAVRTPDVHSILKLGDGPMKSVRVSAVDNDIKIHIYINIESGKRIPKVASEVQKSIKNAVQSMTGKIVTKVDVSIAGMDVVAPSKQQ